MVAQLLANVLFVGYWNCLNEWFEVIHSCAAQVEIDKSWLDIVIVLEWPL